MNDRTYTPNLGQNLDPPTGPPKRILWKWSLVISGGFLAILMWQCGSALYSGSRLADVAVQRFHGQLNRGEFDKICSEADEAFSQQQKHDELVTF